MSQVSELSKRVDSLDSSLNDVYRAPQPATKVIFSQDTDAGNYVITVPDGPTSVGLEVEVSINIPANTFYQIPVFLPDVSGSSGNAEVQFSVVFDGQTIFQGNSTRIGNDTISVNSTLVVPRGSPTNGSQKGILEVLVQAVNGTITVDNADGAELSLFQYEDILT